MINLFGKGSYGKHILINNTKKDEENYDSQ